MKHLIAKAATVSAAAMTMALIPLAGTSYAAGCYGTGCDNRGPVSTGCDADAVTKGSATSRTNSNLRVELRWSPTCQAAWARVTTNGESWWDRYGHIEKWSGSGTGFQRSLQVTFPSSGADWTNMLGSPTAYYRACISDPAATDQVDCTPFW
ncbi:DUF2690 domain-containing protein [Streptomyces sp. NBC_00572]|uniref:DUF2690 domain-containing protein n=1 Tax=Streptomyces sp. NBC_00572 TaxID=2903664 RepID=UPI0022534958|nr:DUF2690 domain-containing protein [Streptomyces sp. NBC_00572]MCX4984639.1 YjfA family protein [Streptomyces sp. NBC_00572]